MTSDQEERPYPGPNTDCARRVHRAPHTIVVQSRAHKDAPWKDVWSTDEMSNDYASTESLAVLERCKRQFPQSDEGDAP